MKYLMFVQMKYNLVAQMKDWIFKKLAQMQCAPVYIHRFKLQMYKAISTHIKHKTIFLNTLTNESKIYCF